MKILHLVFHPDLAKSRVNKNWYELAEADGLRPRNMYSLCPAWKFDVEKEQRLVEASDRIVFQFPFYWYSTPPLMKKWLDDVLTFGWAFGPGPLKTEGKEVLACLSADSTAESYLPGAYNNFTIPEFLRPLQQTAFLCRMRFLPPFWMNNALAASSDEIRAAGLRLLRHVKDPLLSDPWAAQKQAPA